MSDSARYSPLDNVYRPVKPPKIVNKSVVWAREFEGYTRVYRASLHPVTVSLTRNPRLQMLD